MKRIFGQILLFSLLLTLACPVQVFAAGDGNMDGGGSEMGQGTAQNFWSPGNDGVRITVVNAETGEAAAPSVDFSNKSFSKPIFHFEKYSKLDYRAGAALTPVQGNYPYHIPAATIPYIMTSNTHPANIQAIRQYFCSEFAAKMVADATGLEYETLIGGDYKLVIEPICYFTYQGNFCAMTATEASMYNQLSGGALVSMLPNVIQKNLPLAIFLEKDDLGFPAWTGPTNERVTDEQIIAALGIGIVSYKDLPAPEIEAPDVVYRVDTDVITSITLNSRRRLTPSSPGKVTFYIKDRTYRVTNIVMPSYSSQVVWVKWHTPSTPQDIRIRVRASSGNTSETEFIARIESLDENPPPDPQATDTNPRFTMPSLPRESQKTSASWSVWYAYWVSDFCDEGHDHGDWEYDANYYYASLDGDMELWPDDIVPTASGKNMKSGYGVKENANARLSSNAPSSHYTTAQTAVSYFSEFKYQTYWRLLSRRQNGLNSTFQFKENPYSTYNRNVHFSPVWYPDHSDYTVYTRIIDAWTPAGMLSMNVNDSVDINGSLFDDWVRPYSFTYMREAWDR